jgi:Outer membrane protein beta-barrel domain
MRKAAIATLALSLFVPAAAAQVPKVNLFFGYSYAHADLTTSNIASHQGPSVATGNLNGWNASVEGKVVPFLGFVADVSGHYGTPTATSVCTLFPSCPTAVGPVRSRLYNFLGGPQVSFSIGRVRPFAHALFGASHVSETASTVFFGELSDTSFADAFGGGFDYRLVGPLGWRVQADYLKTRFFGNTQDDVRISTGVTFHL